MILENTTRSPTLALKINILMKRDEALQSIENYYRNNNKKRSTLLKLKSKVKVFFLEIRSVLIRFKKYDSLKHTDIKSFEELNKKIYSNKPEDIIKGFEIIDLILDSKHLIRWDNYKSIDTMDLEAENRANHI